MICVNKWDLIDASKRQEYEQAVRDQFKFLDYASIVFLSAKEKRGVRGLFRKISEAYDNFNKRVTTGELNRFVDSLVLPPDRKIYFMTQPSVRPPTFVLFMDREEPLHFSTERHIANRLREKFGFEGTPLVLKVKNRHKPKGR